MASLVALLKISGLSQDVALRDKDQSSGDPQPQNRSMMRPCVTLKDRFGQEWDRIKEESQSSDLRQSIEE